MQFATIVAAAAEGQHGNVMLETVLYPIVALAAFGLFALVTFSYRDVSNRHAAKAAAYARAHAPAQSGDLEAEEGH
jgi:hypothetical protein